MAINVDTTLRNTWLSAIETRAGTSPKVRCYTGSKPANAAASRTGTNLVKISLASDWLSAPSGGSAAMGAAAEATATQTGTIGYWDLVTSDETTVVMQGVDGEVFTFDTTTISAIGQTVRIASLTLTAPNA